jgi:K+-sensing histidine kinase KdpD
VIAVPIYDPIFERPTGVPLMESSQREIVNTFAKKQRLLLICCLIIAPIVLAADYLTGPLIRFPILYLVPIVLAAWSNNLRWGLVFAVAMPLVHLSFTKFWITPFRLIDATINTSIRIIVFVGFAYLANRVAVQKRQLEKEVQTLEGILPICSFCKKIRNQDGNWESIESYIKKNSEAEFSHGVCPDCCKTEYPEIFLK